MAKANADAFSVLVLSVLAGAFIALGATFATTAAAGASGQLPFGVTRVLVGVVFSLGLVLVVVAGAELFTGDNLIAMAWAERRVGLRGLLRNWALVYLGNLAGACGDRGGGCRCDADVRQSRARHHQGGSSRSSRKPADRTSSWSTRTGC